MTASGKIVEIYEDSLRRFMDRAGMTVPPSSFIPESVQIGYLRYVVEEMPESSEDEGTIEHAEQRIRVRSKNRSREYARNTLLHECVHGIFDDTGLDQIEGVKGHEEALVTAVTNGLCALFADNPKIIEMFRQ